MAVNPIHRFFFFSIATTAILLSACSKNKQLENDLEAYSERLQSFTEITVSEVSDAYSLPVPSKSSLKQDIPEMSINLREFYAFNECSLNQLVAQRNTALGKMQLPSARFAYETQLVVQMRSCAEFLAQTEGANDALIDKLNIWANTKQSHLPLAWANLITQSDETYRMLNKTSAFIQGNASDDLQGTKQSLQYLLRIKTEHPVDLSALEKHLQQLDSSFLLSKKWRSQQLLTRHLDAINPLLIEYAETNNCETQKQEADLAIMRNIFTLFFADKIQPVAAELNRYHYQLSPLISELLQSGMWTSDFSAFLQQTHFEEHANYRKSMQRHIELWQSLFAKCG